MTVPLNPKELGRWHTAKPEARPPHRNAYQGGRDLHLAANVKRYDRDIYVILDLSNPAKPFAVSRLPVAAPPSVAARKSVSRVLPQPPAHERGLPRQPRLQIPHRQRTAGDLYSALRRAGQELMIGKMAAPQSRLRGALPQIPANARNISLFCRKINALPVFLKRPGKPHCSAHTRPRNNNSSA